jgi:hypothetical protein
VAKVAVAALRGRMCFECSVARAAEAVPNITAMESAIFVVVNIVILLCVFTREVALAPEIGEARSLFRGLHEDGFFLVCTWGARSDHDVKRKAPIKDHANVIAHDPK